LIDELIDYCATQVTDEQLAGAAIEFPYNSPATKEAYFTGLFLISTIHRQLLHKQLEMDSKMARKFDPSGRANWHTCKH
jgi:asparagine synthase (glutamine-hydrolysing)